MLIILTTIIAVGALLYAGTLRRRVGHRTSAAGAFWSILDIELENARRHDHPVTLIRIADDTHIDSSTSAKPWEPRRIRMTDYVLALPDETYLLAPQTGRSGADVLARRLATDLPDFKTMRMVCFPEDVITRHAMTTQLTRSPSQRGSHASATRLDRQPRATRRRPILRRAS